MKISTIHLDGCGMPESVVATMTAAEAAFFTRVLGKLNGIDSGRFQVVGTYEELSILFNRFYEGGVDEFATPKPDYASQKEE